jgi:hypothetical protein
MAAISRLEFKPVKSKRWIVERTIAWLNRCRGLAKDWENLNRKALAFLHLVVIPLDVLEAIKRRDHGGNAWGDWPQLQCERTRKLISRWHSR